MFLKNEIISATYDTIPQTSMINKIAKMTKTIAYMKPLEYREYSIDPDCFAPLDMSENLIKGYHCHFK
jgi:hypothetical protein